MEQKMSLQQIASYAHSTARDKGFWSVKGSAFATKVALIHTEITEVLEASEEELADELADVVIRVADLSYATDINLERACCNFLEMDITRDTTLKKLGDLTWTKIVLERTETTNLGEQLLRMHLMASRAVEADRRNDFDGIAAALGELVCRTARLAQSRPESIDLDKAVQQKLMANRERPPLHGKRY